MKTIKLSILCLFVMVMNCSSDDSSEQDNQMPTPIGELVIFTNTNEARAFDVTIPYLGKNCESLALSTSDVTENDLSVQVWVVNLGDVVGFDPQTHQYTGGVNELVNAQLVINDINYIATGIEYNLSFTPFEEFTCFGGNGFSGSLMNATIHLNLIPLDSNNGTDVVEVTLNLTNIQVLNDCAC